MGHIAILAFAAALYPPLIAVVLFVLTRPRPRKILGFFLAGAIITAIAAGLLVLELMEKAGLTTSGHSFNPWVDLPIGVISLLLGAIVAQSWDVQLNARRKARKAGKSKEEAEEISEEVAEKESMMTRLLTKDSALGAFLLGVALDLPSIWYLSALNQIANSDYSTGEEVAIVIAFVLVMLSLVEIPLALMIFSPPKGEAFVKRLNRELKAHGRAAGAIILLGIGSYLTVRSLIAIL